MPVLKNPEVIDTLYTSGLTSFRQEAATDLSGDYETDVGVNDPMGLNVLCNSIQVYHPAVKGDCANVIQMCLYLSEEWAQSADFIARMKEDHSLHVQEERLAWGSTMTKLVVSGQNNIRTFGKHLRESFAETTHQGATIQRQIVNPALLGTAIDHMNIVVAASQERKASLGQDWATYDWSN